MNKYYLDNVQINILIVVAGIISFCIIALLYYYVYYIMPYDGMIKQITEVIITGLIILYGAWVIFIRAGWRRSVCYTLTPDVLRIKSGVILSSVIYVRLEEISQIVKLKIPVFYSKNLNFILINVAGKRVILGLLSDRDMEVIYNKLANVHVNKEDK